MKYDKYNKYDKYANKHNDKMEAKTMEKNKAPYEIEGTYMVTITGNETVVTPVDYKDAVHFYKESRGKSKSYKCHPDDKFDAGWVLNDYFDTKERISIGDTVTVMDCGYCYPEARNWIVIFAEAQRNVGSHELADDILLDWGGSIGFNCGRYKVIDSFCANGRKDVFLIREDKKQGKFYLIDRKGLKKVD